MNMSVNLVNYKIKQPMSYTEGPEKDELIRKIQEWLDEIFGTKVVDKKPIIKQL